MQRPPPNGVAVLLLDMTGSGSGYAFPARPKRFRLSDGTFADYECFGPSTRLVFRVGGRDFIAHIAVGPARVLGRKDRRSRCSTRFARAESVRTATGRGSCGSVGSAPPPPEQARSGATRGEVPDGCARNARAREHNLAPAVPGRRGARRVRRSEATRLSPRLARPCRPQTAAQQDEQPDGHAPPALQDNRQRQAQRIALPQQMASLTKRQGPTPNGSRSTCAATSTTSSTRSIEERSGRCSSRTARTSGRASGLRSRTSCLAEFRKGALAGTTPEEAFFVRCDRTTMTQNDLDAGRLVCLVGVAPVRPAEFVDFRIGRWTADHGRRRCRGR